MLAKQWLGKVRNGIIGLENRLTNIGAKISGSRADGASATSSFIEYHLSHDTAQSQHSRIVHQSHSDVDKYINQATCDWFEYMFFRRFFFVPNPDVAVYKVAIRQFSKSFTFSTSGMASQESIPFVKQDSKVVASLVQNLENSIKKGKNKSGFSGKKHTYQIPHTNGLTVDSWRFQDWDYKRDDLPTYARGLFTYKTKDGTPEIAVRGYDKFFNVGEVRDTKWEEVERITQGPYELSVKENGCIIFISGLEDDILLVCSKHSTGAGKNVNLSHAVAGERWVEKYLAAIGKTSQQLARELRERNATVVAELCDDSFEEHILAYDNEKTAGLYIHGINLNLPDFATYPGHLVHEFADEWGFRKAEYLMKDDVGIMKSFLEQCAETGSYNGRDTEGFVIRCQKRVGRGGPYVNWFFKFKFEEPYLLYRQWRECTKAVLAGKAPKYRKHQKITKEYLLYARRQFAQNPALRKAYLANHGIIKMRDGFLEERGLKGSDIIREDREGDAMVGSDVTNNVILVPIATIGCGKTTVAIALTKLFGWGHIQNDNITGKSGRPKQFVIQLSNALSLSPVVIADRNNHQKRERQQLFDDLSRVIPECRFVALHYVHDPKSEMLPEIRRVTQERVFSRGDNHQTIQAGSKSRDEITSIMEGFLHRFEPLDPHSEPDEAFDEVINLDVLESSRHNLEAVVNGLRASYPKLIPEPPSPEALDEAIASAMNEYQVDLKHDLSFQSKNKNKGARNVAADPRKPSGNAENTPPSKADKIEYFCIRVPASTVLTVLETTFSKQAPDVARFYRQLQQSRRIQAAFHVTLIHRASIPQHTDLWHHLTSLHTKAKSSQPNTPDVVLGKCGMQLERIVWDNRVMSIVARIQDESWTSVNAIPHITVGTAETSIKPKESNDLLQRWAQRGANEESGIWELGIGGGETVWGEVKAVVPMHR